MGTAGQFSGKPSNFALKTILNRFPNARHRPHHYERKLNRKVLTCAFFALEKASRTKLAFNYDWFIRSLTFNNAVVIIFVRVNFFSAVGTFPTTVPIHYAITVRTFLEISFALIIFQFARTIGAMAVIGFVIYLIAKRTHLHFCHLLLQHSM